MISTQIPMLWLSSYIFRLYRDLHRSSIYTRHKFQNRLYYEEQGPVSVNVELLRYILLCGRISYIKYALCRHFTTFAHKQIKYNNSYVRIHHLWNLSRRQWQHSYEYVWCSIRVLCMWMCVFVCIIFILDFLMQSTVVWWLIKILRESWRTSC